MKKNSLMFFILIIAITLIFTLSGCVPYNQSQTPLSQEEKQEEEKNQQEMVQEEQGEEEQKEESKEEQKEESKEEQREEPKKEQKEQPKLEPKQENNKNTNQVVNPKPKAQEREVLLYFMDKNIVETGQGDYKDMVKETRKVKVSDQPLEKIILEKLKDGPTSNKGITMLKKELQIISVEVADKTAYVNLSSQSLSGSSLQEAGLIYQVVYSLTELKNIDKVQFLVDGTKRESLFGHYDIQNPWTRAMIQ